MGLIIAAHLGRQRLNMVREDVAEFKVQLVLRDRIHCLLRLHDVVNIFLFYPANVDFIKELHQLFNRGFWDVRNISFLSVG